MSKSLFVALLLASFLWSCAETAIDNSAALDVPITHVVKAGETKTVATLEIEGMMCEKTCVNKIQKELQSVAGVTSADIDFDADRKSDLAIVEFDPSIVDEKSLILAIHDIAEGKLYKVIRMEVVQYEPGQSSVKVGEVQNDQSFDVRAIFQFPNIFGLLEKLIR